MSGGADVRFVDPEGNTWLQVEEWVCLLLSREPEAAEAVIQHMGGEEDEYVKRARKLKASDVVKKYCYTFVTE